jgi:hypothetical protein
VNMMRMALLMALLAFFLLIVFTCGLEGGSGKNTRGSSRGHSLTASGKKRRPKNSVHDKSRIKSKRTNHERARMDPETATETEMEISPPSMSDDEVSGVPPSHRTKTSPSFVLRTTAIQGQTTHGAGTKESWSQDWPEGSLLFPLADLLESIDEEHEDYAVGSGVGVRLEDEFDIIFTRSKLKSKTMSREDDRRGGGGSGSGSGSGSGTSATPAAASGDNPMVLDNDLFEEMVETIGMEQDMDHVGQALAAAAAARAVGKSSDDCVGDGGSGGREGSRGGGDGSEKWLGATATSVEDVRTEEERTQKGVPAPHGTADDVELEDLLGSAGEPQMMASGDDDGVDGDEDSYGRECEGQGVEQGDRGKSLFHDGETNVLAGNDVSVGVDGDFDVVTNMDDEQQQQQLSLSDSRDKKDLDKGPSLTAFSVASTSVDVHGSGIDGDGDGSSDSDASAEGRQVRLSPPQPTAAPTEEESKGKGTAASSLPRLSSTLLSSPVPMLIPQPASTTMKASRGVPPTRRTRRPRGPQMGEYTPYGTKVQTPQVMGLPWHEELEEEQREEAKSHPSKLAMVGRLFSLFHFKGFGFTFQKPLKNWYSIGFGFRIPITAHFPEYDRYVSLPRLSMSLVGYWPYDTKVGFSCSVPVTQVMYALAVVANEAGMNSGKELTEKVRRIKASDSIKRVGVNVSFYYNKRQGLRTSVGPWGFYLPTRRTMRKILPVLLTMPAFVASVLHSLVPAFLARRMLDPTPTATEQALADDIDSLFNIAGHGQGQSEDQGQVRQEGERAKSGRSAADTTRSRKKHAPALTPFGTPYAIGGELPQVSGSMDSYRTKFIQWASTKTGGLGCNLNYSKKTAQSATMGSTMHFNISPFCRQEVPIRWMKTVDS